jgi:BolA protein
VTRQATIESKLQEAFHPQHLEVLNESGMHNVPPGSETHFKVLVVSPAFDGLGLVDRHRRVNQTLRAELGSGLHALSIRALTPAEWGEGQPEVASPQCLGGSKADPTPGGR